METVNIAVGAYSFIARWEEGASPRTCAAFRKLLPFSQRIIHARWSGEACWIPLGDFDLAVGPERQTSTPAPGEILFYPAGISETEILLCYGQCRFAGDAGALAGNHFLTIIKGGERLAELGKNVLWNGSREIRFECAPERNRGANLKNAKALPHLALELLTGPARGALAQPCLK